MASRTAKQRTIKDRNTQRRKRRRTVESKVAEIVELCDFDVVLIMRNGETGEYYTYRSRDSWRPNMEDILVHSKSQNKLPGDVANFEAKKNGGLQQATKKERLRGERREAPERLLSKVHGSDVEELDEQVVIAAPFLAEPPSFDTTMLRSPCGC